MSTIPATKGKRRESEFVSSVRFWMAMVTFMLVILAGMLLAFAFILSSGVARNQTTLTLHAGLDVVLACVCAFVAWRTAPAPDAREK